MSSKPRVLVFAGSARRDSLNKRLARAAALAVDEAGGESTFVDLADFPLPLYDGDLESAEGLPENARRLKELFLQHEALLVACPEYNSSITPLLKNVIDWVSRKASDDEPSLNCYRGKVVLLVAASPGGLGGLRGLVTVRSIFGNLGCVVLPGQRAFSGASKLFGEGGELTDDSARQALAKLAGSLVDATRRLHGD